MAKKSPPRTGKVERFYARQLRKIARHVGDIIKAFPEGDLSVEPTIRRALEMYSETIDGWARAQSALMVRAVDKIDATQWAQTTKELGLSLQREIARTPVGDTTRALLAENVALIKSIPLDAAQRVHRLTLQNLEDSSRSKEIAAEIQRSGEVAESRATLIARTEVARTASKLTEARAVAVGSEGYIWRTVRDSDVRHSHKEMEGKFVRWDENGGQGAKLSDGTICHAGQIYNCRCYPEPVIPLD